MDFILSRYRNLTVLLVAILAQLLLLAYQIRSNGDVRLIRVWAVSLVTPMARLLENSRGGAANFFSNYVNLLGVREQQQQLQAEVDRLRIENHHLNSELATADRAKQLALFTATAPGRFVAARVISNTTSSGALVVIVDRGTLDGVQKGMAVRRPEGVVGKVIQVFPSASFVRLITDAASAAGVISAKSNVHGTLVGLGQSTAGVDHVANERAVEVGEWFYTAGDDLVYPRGIPVGQVASVRNGTSEKEIVIQPVALRDGLEDVLIIVEGVHAPVPLAASDAQPVHVQAPAQETTAAPPSSVPNHMLTDADRLVDAYRKIGGAQNHEYGAYGTRPPNFNMPPANPAAQAAPKQ